MRLNRSPMFALVVVAGLGVVSSSGCKMFSRSTTPPHPAINDNLPHLESTPELEAAKEPEHVLSKEQKANMQLVMAASFEKQDEPEKAIELYSKVVQKDPKRSAANHRLGILYDKTGKHEEAIAAYKKALAQDASNPDIHCDLGYSLYLQRRWAEAETSLRQSLALRPDFARAHNNLGLLLARTSRTEEALWEFARAGCTEPEARVNMAHALMLGQEWAEARQQCELGLACAGVDNAVKDKLSRLRSVILQANTQAAPLPAVDQG